MKEELNIAAILKDKPNTKVWSDTFGELILKAIREDKEYPILFLARGNYDIELTNEGYYFPNMEGAIPCIYPSRNMRDWSKFAWKKGDVLLCGVNNFCIFDKWANNQYTEFYGRYSSQNYSKESDKLDTEYWIKVNNKEVKLAFIKRIEEFHNGTLNLETLEIEQPKQEFKDGDILVAEKDAYYDKVIFIAAIKDDVVSKALIPVEYEDYEVHYNEYRFGHNRILRLATDSEKQQLFEALAKENKKWNPDTLQIEDLPKKCEFKPMDWCLMRDAGIGDKWKLCQFGFFDEKEDFDRAPYNAIGGNWYDRCIPYNDQTKHLLGTTDEWKGGEENA